MCDNWRYKVGTQFFHCLSVPHKSDEDAIGWYKQELSMLKDSLEQFFGATITNKQLQHSVRVCNETRRLLKRLYELRKRENPSLSGVEAQNITVMVNAMPKEEYNKLLERVIDEIGSREGITDYKLRLMVIGCSLDDATYTEIIEELGGLIVTDASCFGTMFFWESVELTEQPLDGIARAYLNRVPCPRIPGTHIARCNYIKEMVEAFDVDGVILEKMMYCSLWGGEEMSLQRDLQELNIPLLILDREYIPSGLGQLRTRVQAFLEMIKGG